MVSDDTDSRLSDGRWRVIVDAEDEQDYDWLFGLGRSSTGSLSAV